MNTQRQSVEKIVFQKQQQKFNKIVTIHTQDDEKRTEAYACHRGPDDHRT